MNARDTIFERLRTATAALPAKQPHPDYDDAVLLADPRLGGGSLLEIFTRNFTAVNGRVMQTIEELAEFLHALGLRRGYCQGVLFEQIGRPLFDAGFGIDTCFDRPRADDYGFGITPATAAIAESGTVVIDDDRTDDRLAALAPWVHVAVLDPATIVRTIPEGLALLGDSRNTVWLTGPSKTADVEGILIEGVHGPGEQIALLMPPRSA